MPYKYHPRLEAVLYVCIYVFSTAPPCPSFVREITKMGTRTSCCSHRRQRQTPPATSLDNRLDFLPNLKDRMHDSAMSVNATTSIDSPCRRLVGSSTSRSRFRTQAHHLRQALVRYPFIHSEEIDLRLSPTETQLPQRGPDAECGTTWVHTMVGVYASVRLNIIPPPSSLFEFIGLVS